MSFVGHFTLSRRSRTDPIVELGRRSRADSAIFRTAIQSSKRFAFACTWRADQQPPDLIQILGTGDVEQMPELLASASGDFAFAFADLQRATLSLGLAPLSELELHVREESEGAVRVATDLAALIGERELPEIDMLGKALLSPAFFHEDRGFYRDLRPVHPGTLVHYSDGGRGVIRFWDPVLTADSRMELQPAGRQLRELLTEVVRERLDIVPYQKGSLLSAGRDSSAVTSVAAELMLSRGERLDAWTAAAFPGGAGLKGYLLDEAPVARQTAARFSNIDHHVRRPCRIDLCQRLDVIHRAIAVPVVQPLAVAWCEDVWDACERQGNRLLLSGDFGNYALSAGGPTYLDDVRRELGVVPYLASACSAFLAAPASARPLVSGLLGRHLRRPREDGAPILDFLKDDLLEACRQAFSGGASDGASYRQWLRQGLRVSIGPNDVVGIGRGLEMTDPTRDRRIVDFVNSLPADLLACPADRRRLFDAAFGDLLPPPVLRPKARGRQNVDWHFSYSPDQLRQGVERYSQSSQVRTFVDCEALCKALAHWPTGRSLAGPIYDRMVWGVLPAISMASFLFTRDCKD